MNNEYLDKAVEELEEAVQIERDKKSHLIQTQQEHYNWCKKNGVPTPKVFKKVEYSPCVTIIDNR